MSDDTPHASDGDAQNPPSFDAASEPVTQHAYAVDESRIPPKPPLPPLPVAVAAEAREESPARAHLRAARDEFESHVSHARGQFDQANERIKARTGRDLLLAIAIAVGLGAVLIASLIFIKELFIPIAVAIAVLATIELARALRSAGRHVDVVPQAIMAGLLVSTVYFGPMWLCWVMLFVAVAFVVVWRLFTQMLTQDGRTYGDVLSDAVASGLVQIYVPFLAALVLVLLEQEGGEWWVLSFIAIAAAADTAAYATGLLIGKHPMAPRISPKKTWEGFGGAVLGAVGVGVLLGIFLMGVPWWVGAILGAAVLVSATLGDLGESMLKRDLGIKDMSSWVPGHGGLLDRLDSILPSAVPALCLYFIVGPGITL